MADERKDARVPESKIKLAATARVTKKISQSSERINYAQKFDNIVFILHSSICSHPILQ